MAFRKIGLGNVPLSYFNKRNLVFADKTRYVQTLEDLGSNAVLFLRPRRFGKTLSLTYCRATTTEALLPGLMQTSAVHGFMITARLWPVPSAVSVLTSHWCRRSLTGSRKDLLGQ